MMDTSAALIDRRSHAPAPHAARRAVAAAFFINGALFANWVSLIPTVQQTLGMSTGVLGVALLGAAAGALVAMPSAGALITRIGSRRVTTVAGLAYCAALPLPILAPGAPLLFLALVAFGACNGAMDVAMNAQGVAVEGRYGRPIMSSFHGLFSLGGLAGAVVSGALAAVGVAPLPHVLGAALALAAALAVAARALLPPGVDVAGHGPSVARLTRPLLGLGVVGFCALIAEGSMADWSALYLRRGLGAGPALAAAGYAAFTLTMAAGRLTGDYVTARLGPVALVRASGALVAAGLGAALIIGQTAATIVGFGLVGVGLANIVPILFSAAGRTPHMAPGPAIAAVTTASYLGFLAGPPAIGVTADHLTLRGALGIVAGLGALIALLAPAVGRTDNSRAEGAAQHADPVLVREPS